MSEKTFKDYTIHVEVDGGVAGEGGRGGGRGEGKKWGGGKKGDNKILIVTKRVKGFATLLIHCKFQPLVFNTVFPL